MSIGGKYVRKRVQMRILLAMPVSEERQIHAIIDAARDWGWEFLDIVLTHGYVPAEPAPCGAIMDCAPTDPLAKRLRQMGLPIVRMGWLPHRLDAEIPAVLPDHAATGRLAAEHFAERGFKHVAYESSVLWPHARPFYTGLEARSRQLGMTCHLFRMGPAPVQTVGKAMAAAHANRSRQLAAWLTALPKPVAILSLSASTLCTLCHQVGLAVPEQVALLGIGNHLLPCELSPVPLSSVDTALTEQARQSALLLHRLIDGAGAPPGPVMIQPRGVVTRRSTDVLAVEDPVVVQAVRFMRDHLARDLSVNAIAAQVGVSSRSLLRAFQRQLNRGVVAELLRRRLRELGHLLRTTDLPVADLTARVGFRTQVHMHKCFREFYGVTPRQYRNGKQGQDSHTGPVQKRVVNYFGDR